MKCLIWLIGLVGVILAYEPTVHREIFDGTEGHLEYNILNLEKGRDQYRLNAGLTLVAYGQAGLIEVNFVNFVDSRHNGENISNETPIEELQIATRFISPIMLVDTSDIESARIYWMIEARGDIKFVPVDIPTVPFVDLSSFEGLRESQRRFYLSSATSYKINKFVAVGFKSTTIMDEYEIPDSGTIVHYSWRHTLSSDFFTQYKTGWSLGLDWTIISSKHYKPQYEFVVHARTRIISPSVPICLGINYKAVHYNYNGQNYPEVSLVLMAINL
ncbi:MAG: hypothetical protein PHS07_00700 [Patescibacteria group bacterium]|nr:hypothetical protein [Patescibacteria group bacterium]